MTTEPSAGPRRSFLPRLTRTAVGRWFCKFWALVVLVLVGMAVCLVNTAENPTHFSPYDEWVYYDYVTKVPTQLFVRQGEVIGEPALEAMACDGDAFGPRGEPCTGPKGVYNEPNLYPQGGLTSADPYTPAYFVITWAAGKVIEFVSGATFLTSARATGALWMGSGLIMLFLLFRQFRLRNIVALGLGLAYVGIGHFAFSYISTDAPSLLVGSTLAWLAVRFMRTGRGGGWLIAASMVGTWFKVTNLLAVGLVALTFVIYALMRGKATAIDGIPRSRRLVVYAALMAVAGVVAELAWLGFRALERVGPSPDQGISAPLSLRGLASGVFVFFFPREGAGGLSSNAILLTAPIITLFMVGIFGWFLSARGSNLNRAWSIAAAVSATLFAPLLTIAFQILLGTAAPVSPRYSAALAPIYLVGIGMIIRNPVGAWLILAYGAGLCMADFMGQL
ncbi:MAG: hypothetical protein H7226_04945 [Salinibacterium sp.]|nr:hypothetical protein [Salinibacterium sp.]